MPARRWAHAAAVLVAVAFAAGAVAYQRSLGLQAEPGRPAPDFRLVDLANRPVSLQDFRGRPVLVNFWTTWCEPCREEVPALESFFRRFGERMGVVGVNVREPLGTVQAFVAEFGVTYPVVRDVDGRLSERYRLRGYPESWLVGPDGVARRYWPGPVTFEQLEQAYRDVMGEPPSAGPGGGPLSASEEGVDLAAAGDWLAVAGRRELVLVRLPGPGGAPQAAPRAVALPDAGAALGGLAALPGGARLAAAVGSAVWVYEIGTGRWSRLAEAPAPVLSLEADAGGRLLAWLQGQGPAAFEGGTWRVLAAGSALPLSGRSGLSRAGAYLAAATPVGLLRAPGEGPAFQRTRLDRPSWDVLAGPAGWWVATDRGVYAYDPRQDRAAPLPGTPVRTFVALEALPGSRLAALAAGGDLYVWTPGAAGDGAGGGRWELSWWERPATARVAAQEVGPRVTGS